MESVLVTEMFLLNLDKEEREKLFKYNEKINGELSMSANKIYSSNSLFNSFESRIKLMNGNILVEQITNHLQGRKWISGALTKPRKTRQWLHLMNFFVLRKLQFKMCGIFFRRLTAANRRRYSRKYFARVTIVPKIVMQ